MDYHSNVIRGMVKTIVDGIKDSDCQLKYAHAAKEAGHQDLAALHIEEAKRRLSGAKDMADGHSEAVAEVLMEHYKEWYREVMDKVIRFNM